MTLLADDTRTLALTGTTAAALSAQPSGPLLAAHARRITLTLAVASGGGNVTSVRWRIRSKPTSPWGPWVTATGVTPAAGSSATIDLTDTVAWHVDVEVTPAADTSVEITLAGAA